jgi:hypothetical protein
LIRHNLDDITIEETTSQLVGQAHRPDDTGASSARTRRTSVAVSDSDFDLSPPSIPQRERPWLGRLILPVTLAAAVVILSMASGDYRYEARASFDVVGPFEVCRSELLDHAWQSESKRIIQPGWRVAADPHTGVLELHLSHHDAHIASSSVRQLADEFEARLSALADRTGDRFLQIESLLSDIVDELRGELRSIQPILPHKQMADAKQSDAAHPDLGIIAKRIDQQVEKFHQLRQAEKRLVERRQRLRRESPQARIEPDDRRIALEARDDLQQDVQHLNMQLTVMIRALQDVSREASPKLAELLAEIERVATIDQSEVARTATGRHRELVGDFTQRARLYLDRLTDFSTSWNGAFARLNSVDDRQRDVIAFSTQQRLHSLLGDFDFRSEKLIEDMRQTVRSISETTTLAADHGRCVATIKRAFHSLSATHRQFVFAASNVYRRNNFRLDGAMKSASGLRRRIRSTIASIDERLESQALARALSQQEHSETKTEHDVDAIRNDTFDTVSTILDLFSDWETSVKLAAESSIATERERAIENRLTRTRSQLLSRVSLLEDVVNAKKRARQESCGVTGVSCTVDGTPTGLSARINLSSALGIITLLGTMFVQTRLAR